MLFFGCSVWICHSTWTLQLYLQLLSLWPILALVYMYASWVTEVNEAQKQKKVNMLITYLTCREAIPSVYDNEKIQESLTPIMF